MGNEAGIVGAPEDDSYPSAVGYDKEEALVEIAGALDIELALVVTAAVGDDDVTLVDVVGTADIKLTLVTFTDAVAVPPMVGGTVRIATVGESKSPFSMTNVAGEFVSGFSKITDGIFVGITSPAAVSFPKFASKSLTAVSLLSADDTTKSLFKRRSDSLFVMV